MFTTTVRRLGCLAAAIVVLSWLLGFLLLGSCATARTGLCAAGGSLTDAAKLRHASPLAIGIARLVMAVACPKPAQPVADDAQNALPGTQTEPRWRK